MKKTLSAVLTALALAPIVSFGASSQCYSIKDSDLKNQCLAETSQCYSIKDKDQKQRCLADF